MPTRPSMPVLIMAASAALLALLWVSLLLSPGWLPISVSAITFGMCTPAVWEVTERIGHSQMAHYVESPNSLLFILTLFALSGWGIYLGVKQYFGAASEELTASQRQLVKQMRAEGLQLDKELVANIKLIKSFLETNEEYSKSLREARRNLENTLAPGQVNVVISFLLTKNAEMQKESALLKQRLEQSQKQVKELRAKLTEALDQGMRDPLTDLGNRRRFDLALAHEVAEAHRNGSKLALVLCDLDHFKSINDKFGHQVGDSILRLFATLLLNNVKGRDIAIRYGGEEFALILPDTDIEGAKNVTENIRRNLESSNWRVTTTLKPIGKVTASFGVAELEENESVQQLIQKADRRLYLAKRSGRNRVEHSSA